PLRMSLPAPPPPPGPSLFPYTTLFRSRRRRPLRCRRNWAASAIGTTGYCWLRDAAFTLYALMTAGYQDEARPGATGSCAQSVNRSEEHTSELQSLRQLVCRLLLEK